MPETWKTARGCNAAYEVSDAGRVRKVGRCVRKIQVDRHGYGRVQVYLPQNRKHFYVHRLVAEVFCDGYAPGMQVNHKNHDKLDNRASNLEWVSADENIQKGKRAGVFRSKKKLNWARVEEMRTLRSKGWPISALSQRFDVAEKWVSAVVRGLVWKPSHKRMAAPSYVEGAAADHRGSVRDRITQNSSTAVEGR